MTTFACSALAANFGAQITGLNVAQDIDAKSLAATQAEVLLDELKEHCAQQRFIYKHKYEVGDVVIWDTLQTMHRATPIDIARGKDDSRLLLRISVRGQPASRF